MSKDEHSKNTMSTKEGDENSENTDSGSRSSSKITIAKRELANCSEIIKAGIEKSNFEVILPQIFSRIENNYFLYRKQLEFASQDAVDDDVVKCFKRADELYGRFKVIFEEQQKLSSQSTKNVRQDHFVNKEPPSVDTHVYRDQKSPGEEEEED